MTDLLKGDPIWKYILMPFISGLIGWTTNVLALQLTFYPVEYIGFNLIRWPHQPCGIFGWQGIIPTKAEKMAGICFDLLMSMIDVKLVFRRLDPAKFSEVMEQGVLLLMDQIINETANEYMPLYWNNLPAEVRDEVVVLADKASPRFLESFISDLQVHIEDVLDVKAMCISACVRNKKLVNKIFLECGEKELTFIRRSGFYFGFLFGLFETAMWIFYKQKWTLPVAGFLAGYLTNWLALKIIFYPLDPVRICNGITLQGLFLKRQKQISETFARINCVEILHIKAMWDGILTGPHHKHFNALLRAHAIVFTENLVGGLKPIAIYSMGAGTFALMKEAIANKVVEKLPTIIDQSFEYTTDALDMEGTICETLQKLSPREFDRCLHPAFEGDEILLILVGAVIGMLLGIFQIFVVF